MATAIMLWHQLCLSLLATQRPRLYFFHLRKVRHFTLKAGFSAKRGDCGNLGDGAAEHVDNYQLGIMHKQVGSLL